MRYSFEQVGQNIFSRKFGGTTTGTADPYISGFWFCWFHRLPPQLTTHISTVVQGVTNVTGPLSNADIQNILTGAALSFTPPGITLNKTEFTGLGGIKWAVPTNIDHGNTISIKYLEFYGTPILTIHHAWVDLIRSHVTGDSNIVMNTTSKEATTANTGSGASTPRKNQYSATVLYWTTTPDTNDVQYYASYTGVFPSKDPQDLFTGDVEAVDKLEIEIEYNADYMYHDRYTYDECVKKTNTITAKRNTIRGYAEKEV